MGAQVQSGRGRSAIVGINVTPMVDVVLVLLVIMMVSATYIVAQSLKVELPKTATSDDAAPQLAKVTLTKDRKMHFGDEEVTEKVLVDRLRTAHAEHEDVSLVLSADQDVPHGAVVHVIDLAKLEGIAKFAIHVERAE
ncbi:Biopolymer transport protein ExbD/TolR [Labilithrix luteola]|uniref:Biopolymer transport protein ExbD/TolR n=1 Tax=Labilithrix luteola TaxID=1391654 RepID=A0A0K1Q6Y9_9BACT|nr:biopolymer transporter ExbD [Labilithrix luteola]AKV01484.1 Biopolymer transport protein ExbD/TolR [Labilithrix luteola]